MAKYVYSFNEGSKDMRNLLGGKGANLAEMTNIGLPVPFGFTITTDACKKYIEDGDKLDQAVIDEVWVHLSELEEVMGLSDRILVMYEGEIVGELDPKKTTPQELGLYMSGAKRDRKEEK